MILSGRIVETVRLTHAENLACHRSSPMSKRSQASPTFGLKSATRRGPLAAYEEPLPIERELLTYDPSDARLQWNL